MTDESGTGVQSTDAPTTVYSVDPARSTFTVKAFAGGLLAGLGHNPVIRIRTFSGDARFDPDSPRDASVRLTVDAGSLDVVDGVTGKDRAEIERVMRQEVLEVGRYPEIVFESTSVTPTRVAEGVYKVRLVGTLSLHGVSTPGVWISAKVRAGADEIRAEGDFTLKQTDYGIKLVSVAGGILKVKDELQFSFDLCGRRASGG